MLIVSDQAYPLLQIYSEEIIKARPKKKKKKKNFSARMSHHCIICKTPPFGNLVKLHSFMHSLKMTQKDISDRKE